MCKWFSQWEKNLLWFYCNSWRWACVWPWIYFIFGDLKSYLTHTMVSNTPSNNGSTFLRSGLFNLIDTHDPLSSTEKKTLWCFIDQEGKHNNILISFFNNDKRRRIVHDYDKDQHLVPPHGTSICWCMSKHVFCDCWSHKKAEGEIRGCWRYRDVYTGLSHTRRSTEVNEGPFNYFECSSF